METIHLMAQCKTLILSHSTFSWWAGVLASKNGAKVYAPVHIAKEDVPGNFNSGMMLDSWHSIINR
jgi:hypothetical protein